MTRTMRFFVGSFLCGQQSENVSGGLITCLPAAA